MEYVLDVSSFVASAVCWHDIPDRFDVGQITHPSAIDNTGGASFFASFSSLD